MNIELLNNYYLCPQKVYYDTNNRKATKNFHDYYLAVCHQIVGHYFISYNPHEKQLAINRLYKRFDKLILQLKAAPEIIQAFKNCSKTLVRALDSHVDKESMSIIGPTIFTKEFTIGEKVEFTIDGISKKISKTTGAVFYDFYISYPFLSSYKGPWLQSLMLNAMREMVMAQSIFDPEDLNRSRFIIVDPFTPKLIAISLNKLKLDVRFNFIEQLLAGISLELFFPRPEEKQCQECVYRKICDYSL